MPLGTSKSRAKARLLKLCAFAYDSFGYVSYKITAFISLVVLKLFFRLKVKDSQYLPKEGPIILAANHSSVLDPWVLQVACSRRISYLVEGLYYKSWWWWFYRLHKAIPVGRRGLNKDAIVTALHILSESGVLGIFPEGWGKKVDGRVGQGNPGVAMMSCKSHVPVLPIYIDGCYEVLPQGAILPHFKRLTVTYGKPIKFSNTEKPNKEALRKMTDEIMQKIRELGEK